MKDYYELNEDMLEGKTKIVMDYNSGEMVLIKIYKRKWFLFIPYWELTTHYESDKGGYILNRFNLNFPLTTV